MITVKVQQRYPVPVQVQPQNGIQVKAYQAGPPGIQGVPGPGVPVGGTAGQVLKKIDGTNYNTHWQDETGSTPIVGLTEVAFGAPVTGVLTSDPNIHAITNFAGFSTRGYLQAYGARIGNINGGVIQVQADNISGWTYLDISAPGNNHINFINESGTIKGILGVENWRFHSGITATDYSIRLDKAGAKIGPYSQAGTANSYAFEIQHHNTGGSAFIVYSNSTSIFGAYHSNGIGVQASYYLGELAILRNSFGVGEKMTWGDNYARISTVMDYDGGYLSDLVYTARYHTFSGTRFRVSNLAGTGNRRIHVNASGDFVATEPAFDIVNEVPAGLINGINATFTTAGNFEPGTEEVYLNGLKLVKLEDYNTTGTNQIDLYVAPGTGEDLIVNYKKA